MNEEERKAFFLNIAQLLRRHSALLSTHLSLPSLSSLSSPSGHTPYLSLSSSISSSPSSPASSSRVVHEKEDQEVGLKQVNTRDVISSYADGVDLSTNLSSFSSSFSSSLFSSSSRLASTTSTEDEEETVGDSLALSRKNQTSQMSSCSSSRTLPPSSPSFTFLFFLLFFSFLIFFSSLSSFLLSLVVTKIRGIYLSFKHHRSSTERQDSPFPPPAFNKVADRLHTSLSLPAPRVSSVSTRKMKKKDTYHHPSSVLILHDGKKAMERKKNKLPSVSLPEEEETQLRERERRRQRREERRRIKERLKTHKDMRETCSLCSSCEELEEEENGANNGVVAVKILGEKKGDNKKKDLSVERGVHHNTLDRLMMKFLPVVLPRRVLLLSSYCPVLFIFLFLLKIFRVTYHFCFQCYFTLLSLFHSLRACLFPSRPPPPLRSLLGENSSRACCSSSFSENEEEEDEEEKRESRIREDMTRDRCCYLAECLERKRREKERRKREEKKGKKEEEGNEETAFHPLRCDAHEEKKRDSAKKKKENDRQKERRKKARRRSNRWIASPLIPSGPARTSYGERRVLSEGRKTRGRETEEEDGEAKEEEEGWCSMNAEKKYEEKERKREREREGLVIVHGRFPVEGILSCVFPCLTDVQTLVSSYIVAFVPA